MSSPSTNWTRASAVRSCRPTRRPSYAARCRPSSTSGSASPRCGTSYAAATATATSYNRILDAASPGESDRPAKTTTIGYRYILSRLWLLDPVPGWIPTGNASARLQQAPKHHLGGESSSLLGALFESLAALTVRVLAQAAEASVGHLRTRNGDRLLDAVVLNTGDEAYRRRDGIAVVPLALLGPRGGGLSAAGARAGPPRGRR
ncbi:hypothetical protein GCM10023350_25670 [Nocardioides endophyticus]|uniref:Uncharacterized protein n=1 Tax=Nocardioides endophyticus TaxID=1353775 RepID=A0ABP8YWK4_9ACTN